MQRRRAQGLCFNYNERFTARHRYQKPQLLLLEWHVGTMVCEDITNQPTLEEDQGEDTEEVQ